MSQEFEPVFAALRVILEGHSGRLRVKDDSHDRYCLEARVGPATLLAWGGTARMPWISVAWVEIGKSYVSYHLMGVYGNARLSNGMSKELKARMQGKSCFNFKSHDEVLFGELEQLTAGGLAALQEAGFISEQETA